MTPLPNDEGRHMTKADDMPETICARLTATTERTLQGSQTRTTFQNGTLYRRADLPPSPEALRGMWRSMDSAPELERVFVGGYQPRKGTVAGYWWWEEGVVFEGNAIKRPAATHWHPILIEAQPDLRALGVEVK